MKKSLLFIPDISGFTKFIQTTEADHSQHVIAELLEVMIDANILTADISRVQMDSIEGVQIINLHSLSNALKPLMETGELIKIKVQRFGKEPRQGVGYLDDGTITFSRRLQFGH